MAEREPLDPETRRQLEAELGRLQTPEHRATYVNHIGPNVTARRIRDLQLLLDIDSFGIIVGEEPEPRPSDPA